MTFDMTVVYFIIPVLAFIVGLAVGDFFCEARLRIRMKRWFLSKGHSYEEAEDIVEEVCYE